MENIKIGNKIINEHSNFFIIEEGQANWGDFNKALKMIDVAVEAGGDAIEFQFAIPSDFYVKDHPYLEVYNKTQLPINKMIEIVNYCKKKEIEIIVAPLSHNLIKPLKKAGCSAFNINASDINNPQILDSVAESGLPFFLSLPLAEEKEIDWAINRLNSKRKNDFILLHGQHTMASGEDGVSIEHTSLGYINKCKEKYNKLVGFIDHSPLLWTPSLAYTSGANIVSKHLCISRTEKGPDWHICLEPAEMKDCINKFRQTAISINQKDKVLAPGENIDRSMMRRSMVALNKINKGDVITKKDITFKRPGDGVAPSDYEKFINKVALRDIDEDAKITYNDIKK
jgi:N,N'-diacetyllegionaminate synthase